MENEVAITVQISTLLRSFYVLIMIIRIKTSLNQPLFPRRKCLLILVPPGIDCCRKHPANK